MILDYLDRTSPEHYRADLCVVGAGPAGIAIATAFAGSRFTVCLIESGGLASEPAAQALNHGDSVGMVQIDPALSRIRAFGGSCRIWGGGCVPLARLDIEARDWVPNSGWPISFDEVAAYCERARAVCGIHADHAIGDGSFRVPQLAHGLQFTPGHVVDRICVESPVMFERHYRNLLAEADNVQLVLHANLTGLEAARDSGRIQSARIGSLDGRRGTVTARHYVLAAGGIENARLMLQSNDVFPRGIGNRHDQVGRYFMDHPRCLAGQVHGGDLDRLIRPYDREAQRETRPLYRELGLADDAQRRFRLLNGRARPFAVARPAPAGLQALRDLRASFHAAPASTDRQDMVDSQVLEALAWGIPGSAPTAIPGTVARSRLAVRMGMNFGHVAAAAMRRLRHRPVDGCERVDVMTYFEQSPNPESRITLGDGRDALGQRKVCIDWRLAEGDFASYRTSAALFGTEAARSCGGRFEPAPWIGDPALRPKLHGTAHHIGTTRMSARPEDGVVDRDCKVHGIANLHVAGSSVFPTGGWAFPTLTIVALAIRLSDRLRGGLEILGA